ncbi:PBSX family phage terminase large subunit [Anaerosporobacter mobilis]|uniref:PBSX family phage terminase large subunit n=1 Tax=Anaerosporobacter mobilis TaxID=264463 RepID=UPI001FA88D6D
MSRLARSPNEQAEKAHELYRQGMMLVEIASQLNKPVGTIRSWKNRYQWECNATQEKKRNVAKDKKNKAVKKEVFDDGTKETMRNDNLTHEQRLFCIYYSKIFNATQSYIKAYGCSYDSAKAHGFELLQNVAVKEEVQRLQELKRKQIVSSTDDLVDLHMRIAFADIGDYLSFKQEQQQVIGQFGPVEVKDEYGDKKPLMQDVNVIRLNDSRNVDTQLIQEVKQGRDGVSIKLADKQKSLDWLEKFFLMNPMDKHKIAYDNAKLELERKKAEPEDKEITGTKYNGIPATMIAPAFIKVVHDIEEKMYNEYVFSGGRASTKSCFISLQIIDLLMKDDNIHACILRQVADTLRTSVYQQMIWAISALGLLDEFHCTVSPLEITRKSTGQKIYFRGADDPNKIKSIKAPFGYIAVLWFEELDQFKGSNEDDAEKAVRKMEQSVIRGGDKAYIFKSFNPPKSASNWANKYIKVPNIKRLVIHSTYLDVPAHWLGKPFIEQAEHLREVNPIAYENEYMGVANGTGGNVFDNVNIRTISDEEIAVMDRMYFGVDWGWYPDPWAYNKMYYNAAQHKLYILDEDRRNKTKNKETARILKEEHGIQQNDKITCDSAEQKSISDYKEYDIFARGAIKGPGSVEYSMKWLASLAEIIIDNCRTPHTATEFLDYEYDRDKEGNIISGYPDKNNHQIDAVRYALEEIWRRRGQ